MYLPELGQTQVRARDSLHVSHVNSRNPTPLSITAASLGVGEQEFQNWKGSLGSNQAFCHMG